MIDIDSSSCSGGVLEAHGRRLFSNRTVWPGRRVRASDGKVRFSGLHAFQGERETLAHADAEGAERVAALAAFQLAERSQGQARAAHAQGMAERDRSAVRVHLRRIVGQPELAQAGQRLSGKG